MNQKMKELGKAPSTIRQLFEYGKLRKQEIGEDKVFDFSIGNPSVPSPSIVNETLIKLIETTDATKLHGYTSAVGDLGVRKSIKNYLNNKYDASVDENLIYLTVGAAASLSISLNAILNEDDEVIVFCPFFPEYKVFVEKAKGKIVLCKCDDTFIPDFEYLESIITKKTKAVIINYPNNPTGIILTDSEIIKLATILNKKQLEYNNQIYIISDEPYRELVYDNIVVPFVSNYYANTLICYSFSKSLSLAGERIGYIIVNSNMNNSFDIYYAICGAARSLGYVCAPSLFQYMIPNCLGHTSDISIYKTNRDILTAALKSYGYKVIEAKGAFYLFVQMVGDNNKFMKKAIENELLLVPSDSFGIKGYVRISYCVSTEQINNSLPAFKKLIEEMKTNEQY